MNVFICLSFILILPNVVDLIQPITKPNGDPDMNSIMNHMALIEQTITSLQTQVQTSNTDIAILKHDLQKCPDLVEFDKLKSDLKDTQRQLAHVSSVVVGSSRNSRNISGYDVAFQVSQQGDQTAVWTTLKFNTVHYNAGDGYNNTTGMFTAPLSGTYIFWVTIEYETIDINSYVSIRHGQVILAQAFTRPAGTKIDARTVSVTTVTHLNQGDLVHFSSDCAGGIHADGLSSYGGALLHAV